MPQKFKIYFDVLEKLHICWFESLALLGLQRPTSILNLLLLLLLQIASRGTKITLRHVSLPFESHVNDLIVFENTPITLRKRENFSFDSQT